MKYRIPKIAICLLLAISVAGCDLSRFVPRDQLPGPVQPVEPGGVKLLIVYETASGLPEKQRQIINSVPFKKYLDQHCAKDVNGQPQWRMLDKDTLASGRAGQWSELYLKLPPASLPWLYCTKPGSGGYNDKLPLQLTDTQAIVTKLAGP